ETLRPDLFLALADGITPAALATASGLALEAPSGGEAADLGRLVGRGLVVYASRGALASLLATSDLVLSQAGTATIQTLGSGRPVVAFTRAGDRSKRFREEGRLFGEARLLAP